MTQTNQNPPTSMLDELENTFGSFAEQAEENSGLYEQGEEQIELEEAPMSDIDIRRANIESLKQSMLKQRELNKNTKKAKKGEKPQKQAQSKSSNLEVQSDSYETMDGKFIPIDMENLPSKGMFYPSESIIYIRSANVAEIRQWSMWETNNLTQIDEQLNFILSKCVQFYDPIEKRTWRDIKDIDRLYIILAIRDLTFPPGINDLQIEIGQNKKMKIDKNAVNFIEFPEKIMKYYSEEDRCFVVKTPEDSEIRFFVPCLGVNEFVKNYIIKKTRSKEPFDTMFCQMFPYLIDTHSGLDEEEYNEAYKAYTNSSIWEASVMSEFRNEIASSVNPTFTYEDEEGEEHKIPFSFLGGFRSLFVLQNLL